MIDMALYRNHSLTAQMKSQMSCKYLQKDGGGALGSAPGYTAEAVVPCSNPAFLI